MKIIIVAHGKIKKGPELELISDYVTRFNRQFNNDFLTSLEISESNEIEGTFNTKVSQMLDGKETMVLLDKSGEHLDSEGFAKQRRVLIRFTLLLEDQRDFQNCSPQKLKRFWQFPKWSFLTKLLD